MFNINTKFINFLRVKLMSHIKFLRYFTVTNRFYCYKSNYFGLKNDTLDR